MFKAVADSLLSIAFPQHCRLCTRPVERRSCGIACSSCWSRTRLISADDPACGKCGDPLPVTAASAEARCRACGDHSYDLAVAGGLYEHALAATVLEMKRTPHLPARAGEILLAAFERVGFADVLIPVPLSDKRRIERGFNQAEVLGEFLSARTGVPLDRFSLARAKHTPVHRAGMDRKARESTVKNAFAVARPRLVAGKNVVLVDDIFTTGATASHCAEALKKSGASRVNVVTLARAVRLFD